MTQTEFGQAILECFTEVYGKCYIGSLIINKIPGGFDIGIGFNHRETPLHIMGQMDEEDFIKYFKKELRKRHFDHDSHSHIAWEYNEVKPICQKKI